MLTEKKLLTKESLYQYNCQKISRVLFMSVSDPKWKPKKYGSQSLQQEKS